MARSEVVFRVQDDEGRGPFKPGFSKNWVESREDHDNLKPWFQEFGPVHEQVLYGSSCGSACSTVEQLRRWFTESEYRSLQTFGYQAVRMSVDRIIAQSDIQCFITRSIPLNERVTVFGLYP